VDCHGGHGHDIKGRAFSVSVEDSNGVACTDCHAGTGTPTPASTPT